MSLLLNVHAPFESIPFKPSRDFALSIEVYKPFEKVRLPVQLQARVLGICLGFRIQHQCFHVCILSQQSAFCGDQTQWLELVIQERYGWPGPTFDQHSSSQEWFWCRGNWLTPLFSHKKHSNQTQTPCLEQRTLADPETITCNLSGHRNSVHILTTRTKLIIQCAISYYNALRVGKNWIHLDRPICSQVLHTLSLGRVLQELMPSRIVHLLNLTTLFTSFIWCILRLNGNMVALPPSRFWRKNV